MPTASALESTKSMCVLLSDSTRKSIVPTLSSLNTVSLVLIFMRLFLVPAVKVLNVMWADSDPSVTSVAPTKISPYCVD